MNLSNLKVDKKVIYLVVGVILLGELIWAGRTLTGNSSGSKQKPAKVQVVAEKSTLTLSSPRNSYKVGENIPVTVSISSNRLTVGTDMVVIFDPKILSVVSSSPLQVSGGIYENYPLNKADGGLGRIYASGVTSQSAGVVTKGVFGTLLLQAKAAGKTKISIDFTPGSTVDSNIIEAKSSQDILDSVDNLEIVIQ